MRNLLLAVLLLAPLTAAASDSECVIIAELAKSAAEGRDNGLPLSKALGAIPQDDAESAEIVRTTIVTVYSYPTVTPAKVEQIYLSQCPEPSPEQPAQPSWRT